VAYTTDHAKQADAAHDAKVERATAMMAEWDIQDAEAILAGEDKEDNS
jgi:hypothetical protein